MKRYALLFVGVAFLSVLVVGGASGDVTVGIESGEAEIINKTNSSVTIQSKADGDIVLGFADSLAYQSNTSITTYNHLVGSEQNTDFVLENTKQGEVYTINQTDFEIESSVGVVNTSLVANASSHTYDFRQLDESFTVVRPNGSSVTISENATELYVAQTFTPEDGKADYGWKTNGTLSLSLGDVESSTDVVLVKESGIPIAVERSTSVRTVSFTIEEDAHVDVVYGQELANEFYRVQPYFFIFSLSEDEVRDGQFVVESRVSNNESISFSITNSSDAISIRENEQQFELQPGTAREVPFTVNSSKLTPGLHTQYFVISTENETSTVYVRASVRANPIPAVGSGINIPFIGLVTWNTIAALGAVFVVSLASLLIYFTDRGEVSWG